MSVSGGLWKQQQNPARPEESVLRLFSLHTVRKKKGASTLSSWGAAMLLLRWSPKKLARDFFIILPHVPALLMTSLIQTAAHKMAALTVVRSPLSNVDFLHRTINAVKKLLFISLLYFFFSFFILFFFFFFFTLSLLSDYLIIHIFHSSHN